MPRRRHRSLVRSGPQHQTASVQMARESARWSPWTLLLCSHAQMRSAGPLTTRAPHMSASLLLPWLMEGRRSLEAESPVWMLTHWLLPTRLGSSMSRCSTLAPGKNPPSACGLWTAVTPQTGPPCSSAGADKAFHQLPSPSLTLRWQWRGRACSPRQPTSAVLWFNQARWLWSAPSLCYPTRRAHHGSGPAGTQR